MTGRMSIQLRREKEVISVDGETGGTEKFVMVDLVSVTEEKFTPIVEAKRSFLGQAMKQCLLVMKDMGDKNAVVVMCTDSLQREKVGEWSNTMAHLLR